jgi:hypothetical protein
MTRIVRYFAAWVCLAGVAALWAHAEDMPGESGALPKDRISQVAIAEGEVELRDLRLMGLRFFTTPMNRLDGFGDGPMNPDDTVAPGGRPTLGGNGTFLRVNGLDAQTCLECHSIVSAATVPPRLGIGGVGGSNANALISPTEMDPAGLAALDGTARFNGRFANPPFLFGAGAVELLALEMTADLQALARKALDHPGTEIELLTKGVHFGLVKADAAGVLDFSGVTGVRDDLVVRPFGRKGEFATIRDFDIGAVQFHLGMQPTEVVGPDVDDDGDGVLNEILPGDLTSLSVFIATLERPVMEPLTASARRGLARFEELGCVECHRPRLETARHRLPLRLPELPTDPWANVQYQVDLSKAPVNFPRNAAGGVSIPLFADLKRHDMGEGLKESFALVDEEENRLFTTARLWGVADTAPYLHDGRATTLSDAILQHGGEAQQVRDAFADLEAEDRKDVLAFLRSLRTPEKPAADLLKKDAPKRKSSRPSKSAKSGAGAPKRKSGK